MRSGVKSGPRPRASALPPRPVTFWVTRQRERATFTDQIDVWLLRPERVVVDGRAEWLLPPEGPQQVNSVNGPISAHLTTCNIAGAMIVYGTVPDDDKMLIRNGDESPDYLKEPS